MKAESRQITQKLAARLKFVYCLKVYTDEQVKHAHM